MNKSNNAIMKKVFHVMYDDDEKLLVAARELVEKAYISQMYFRHFLFTELIQ